MEDKIEEILAAIRVEIEGAKARVSALPDHSFFKSVSSRLLQGANIPISQQSNMLAHITLAFRHLEDARMRIGKVLQAHQGGISILDRTGDTSSK